MYLSVVPEAFTVDNTFQPIPNTVESVRGAQIPGTKSHGTPDFVL